MAFDNPVTHLALSGGIGGAKLALGLEHLFNSPKLMIAGNTGDDFEHFGLSISPDLDTLLYTLSDMYYIVAAAQTYFYKSCNEHALTCSLPDMKSEFRIM